MKDSEREPRTVLSDMAPMLSVLATRALYEEQPEPFNQTVTLFSARTRAAPTAYELFRAFTGASSGNWGMPDLSH